jgi:putative MFS transporter
LTKVEISNVHQYYEARRLGMEGKSVKIPAVVPRGRGYLCFLIILMGFAIMMDNWLSILIGTVRPYVLKEYQLPPAAYSAFESAMWILAIFIFTFNWTMDIVGRKWAIFILSAGFTILSVGILVDARSFAAYGVLCALIYYLLMANTWATPVAEESPPEFRGRAILFVLAIGALPAISSRFVIPWVMGNWGWRGMYIPVLIFFVPFAIMWFFMKETQRFEVLKAERAQRVKRRVENPFRTFRREYLKGMLVVGGTYFCWAFAYLGSLWFGYFVMTVRGWPLTTWATLATVNGLAQLAITIGTGWLFDYLGRIRTFAAACVVATVAVAYLGYASNAALWVFIPVTQAAIIIQYNFIQVYASEMFPTEIRATGLGMANSFSRIGMVMAPLLAAALIKNFPTMEGFWLVFAVLTAAPLLVLLLRPVETKQEVLEVLEERRVKEAL